MLNRRLDGQEKLVGELGGWIQNKQFLHPGHFQNRPGYYISQFLHHLRRRRLSLPASPNFLHHLSTNVADHSHSQVFMALLRL